VGRHIIRIPPHSPLVPAIMRAAMPYLAQTIENPDLADHIRRELQGRNQETSQAT